MRKIYLLLITICLVHLCSAQHIGAYGNEWIDYTPGHQYYKIKVKADGFYRIPYSTLSTAVPNLSSINPNDFVLYHNGEKVAINVSTSGGAFDTASYIEFYGKRNYGDVDSTLYPQPGYQPHTFYSLFNDTSIYFLTTHTGGNNFHYQFVNNDTAAIPGLTEDMYFWFTYKWFYGPTSTAPATGVVARFCEGTPFVNGTDYLYKAIYDLNESWGGGWINYCNSTSPQTIYLLSPAVYPAGPPAVLSGNIYTRTFAQHDIKVTFNNVLVNRFTFDNSNGGFSRSLYSDTIPLSSLSTNSANGYQNANGFQEAFVSSPPCTSASQENLLMYTSLTYPRKYDFGGANQFYWRMKAANGQRYIRVNNVVTTPTQPLLYDITNGYIIQNTDAPATLPKKWVLPAASGDRELFFRTNASASYTVIGKMDTITFQDYNQVANQSNYMVITHSSLRRDSAGHDYVKDYADYRDISVSPATGKYKARIYDIDQIMDQYGYGVRKTPLAVRNFVEYAYDHWTNKKPEYLFIIGKGRAYNEIRGSSSAYAYDHDLITPFGSSPSDILLACRRGSNIPLIAVGRLAAQTTYDVANYLDKVRQYESLQNTYGDPHQNKAEKLWMKQIMHFSGGSSQGEQQQFASYLSNYANIAKDTSWGANTSTIYKTSSQPVDNSQAQIIRARIDSGVSLMTFFGHAAGTTFDISVDDPRNWTNYEKYPMIYSNGCQSGDISSIKTLTIPPLPTFSELSVLTPGKCAVAFTATSNLSTSNELDEYATYAYQAACQNAYDQPWGKALQKSQMAMDANYGGDDFAMLVAYEMTLHGDPALTLNQYSIPDYEIDQSSLYFNPQTVDARTDSFEVNVIVANLGKAIRDSIQISLTRSYPDPVHPGSANIQKIYKWKVKAPYYIDTISFKIPTFLGLDSGFGQNQFNVFVESEQRITELSETNNGGSIQFGLSIQSDDILPIYPYEFAIVPTQNITLKASTVNPFAAPKNYKIQIDTSELFQHPIAQANIYQGGGVLHWAVPFTFRDSTVYYWRVSRDSINDSTSYRWHYSSFVYIRNEYPGWNQSHYYQYGHDKYNDNVYLDRDRVFKFVQNINSIHVKTGWASATGGGPVPYSDIEWDMANVTQFRYNQGGCGYANPYTVGGVTFAVIDSVTGIWQSFNVANNTNPAINNGRFRNFHCASNIGGINGFDFNVNSTAFDNAISNFLDSVPNGAILVMYSVNQINWAQWGNVYNRSFNKLVAMGATGMNALKTGAHAAGPYIFFTQKGDPSKSKQYTGTGYAQALEGTYDFGTIWNKGTYQSTDIGPATEWGSFHWRYRQRENTQADQQSVDIIGLPTNGIPTLLLTTTAPDTTIGFIDPVRYPNIRLRYSAEDDTTHTPSQLYYWRVLYKKVPEAAINPAAHFVTSRDTLGLGDTLNVEVALENVSDLPMDSIRTLYTFQKIGGIQSSSVVKSDSLRVGQTQILKFRQLMNNSNYAGNDRLVIEANPNDALHQLEQYHFNNYAVYDFSSTADKINPLLDVTFDGRRIMNNDLVSAKPDVLISMKDENKTLALNDTSLAQVYIRYPGQVVPTLINYDNNILTFYPATGNIAKRNQARIELKPTFMVDGTYDLLVRDKDKSGNYSSNSTNKYEGTPINGVYYDYKISFNVITKSMITNVLNYPNPFTTRTQFVFTLTGSEIPDYMKIQIMTITGKVVKEIQRAELGNIHIGVNRTDYYWDGRDEYGDKLANGVYFYRVITKIEDKNVDHMNSGQYGQFFNNTNIDKYFKHGFGKLVIMR